MRKSRVLAIMMAVLMVVTLLPSMVFAAAAPSGALDGTLKIKGNAAVGATLSADYSKVKPEGITDDLVDFSWSLKDGDLLTEVSTEKTYKIDEAALGLPVVLKITGKSDKGISGELTAKTYEVSATEEEAKALAEQKKAEEKSKENAEGENTEASEDSNESEVQTDASAADSTQNIEEKASDDSAVVEVNGDSENSGDTEAVQEETSKDEDASGKNTDAVQVDGNGEQQVNGNVAEELTYSASAATDDGSGILNFGSAEEGYTETPEAQYVSITNTGTGELNFKSLLPEHFMVQDINDQPLKAGETVTAWVAPREELPAGEYKDPITYETEEGVQVSFEADFTVKAAEKKEAEAKDSSSEADDNGEQKGTFKLSADNPELSFEPLTEGYGETETRTVTIKNEGTETATLVQPESDYFDIEPVTSVEADGNIQIAAGKDQTFTVQPKAGLSAKEEPYAEDLKFSAKEDENAAVTIKAQVTVKAAVEEKISVSVDPSEKDFGSLEQGYSTAPDAATITVTNTGNVALRLAQPEATNYEVGAISSEVINPEEKATFTIQPKTGLSAGEYNGKIYVKDLDGNELAFVSVSFVVSKKSDNNDKAENLTGIKKPSDIKDLPNGTEKSQKALKLPSTVKITTTKGEKEASVKWDVKGCSYNPSSSDRQTFNVKGTVTLPDGVKNPDKISTVIAVSVTVNGYTGSKAKESDNKITGIDANGKYDTNSKITFTAVGAGMNNESPKKGDTRFLPASWKITETRTWDAAPYTATFRVSKPGQYTLKVTFAQQKYDGSKWSNTGNTSESQVTFTVSQAAALTATPSPAVTGANKKSAVQTGDSTPIMTFVIILVIAAVCIGGVLVYRKKKK